MVISKNQLWVCWFSCLEVSFLFIWVFCHLVAQLCLTFCDLMDYSMPVLPVLHYLPEFAQTHVHSVDDAVKPSHPQSLPSPPAINLSQHQALFQWISFSHQVAKVLELELQHPVFPMNNQCWFPLGLTGLRYLLPQGLSRVYFFLIFILLHTLICCFFIHKIELKSLDF